ncbi:MAG: hypothetical protein P8I94_03035 [Emcibacteraceae bacterium]|nr:hypothetical protein [Emcibacteraceae bacterium]
MTKYILTILSLLLITISNTIGAEKLNVDHIIEGFIDNIGGLENIKAIQNLTYSGGTYHEESFSSDGDATMTLGRPYYKLVGNKNNLDRYMEGYDGSAWEYYSNEGIILRTDGAPSEAIRHYAGVEHPLVGYRLKGSNAELLDDIDFEGQKVHIIKLTRMDGYIEYFYIDPLTYELKASSSTAPFHAFGESILQITKISDYREVAGVKIGHRFQSVTLPNEKVLSSMQWGKVEANKELPDNLFSPPDIETTLLQEFASKLYEQRSDLNSVLWTYHSFRHAYPNYDTCYMSNFVGFQMLKMKKSDTAIELLKQNTQDYPECSEAYFELGRAYVSINSISLARENYKKSVKIDPENERAKTALLTINN